MKSGFFRLNRWDLALCAVTLLAALALAGWLALSARGDVPTVEIAVDGQVIFAAPLDSADTRVEVPGEYPLTVTVQSGQVWVTQSSCPGGDCQAQGVISRPGQSIVCLPGRVAIHIRGDAPADLVVG